MHAKGPWEVFDDVIHSCGEPLLADGTHFVVASIADSDLPDDGEQAADTLRLLAAAPGLLAACKGLLEFIEPRLEREGGIVGCRTDSPCAACAARAAIAKAEGVDS